MFVVYLGVNAHSVGDSVKIGFVRYILVLVSQMVMILLKFLPCKSDCNCVGMCMQTPSGGVLFFCTNLYMSVKRVSRAKWRTFLKCSHKIRFARRSDARLPYPTLTGGHQVCITRQGDPVLRLLTNRGRENHLFASSVSPTEAHLNLREDR